MNIGVALIIAIIFFMLSGVFIIFTIAFNRRILSHRFQVNSLKQEQTKNLLKATIETQEVERTRIGANIHDDVGPILSAIKLQINQLKSAKGVSKLKRIHEIQKNLDGAIALVREVSRDLVPSVLYELGLKEAIQNLAERISDLPDMEMVYDLEGDIDNFPKQKELAIFRIIQESITNIMRHAHAKNIVLQIKNQQDKLSILIQDDGKGFDKEKIQPGLGLKNMQARTESMGGEMLIESEPGQGTTMTFLIPHI